MSFAALRDRVNNQALAKCGDVVTKGGLPLLGKFSNGFLDAGRDYEQTDPFFECLQGLLVKGEVIDVNGTLWRVVNVEPEADSNGMMIAQLEKV